jgi:hypothetical protein
MALERSEKMTSSSECRDTQRSVAACFSTLAAHSNHLGGEGRLQWCQPWDPTPQRLQWTALGYDFSCQEILQLSRWFQGTTTLTVKKWGDHSADIQGVESYLRWWLEDIKVIPGTSQVLTASFRFRCSSPGIIKIIQSSARWFEMKWIWSLHWIPYSI